MKHSAKSIAISIAVVLLSLLIFSLTYSSPQAYRRRASSGTMLSFGERRNQRRPGGRRPPSRPVPGRRAPPLSRPRPGGPSSSIPQLVNMPAELLRKTYANQLSISHTGTLKTTVFLGDETPTSTVEIRQKDGKMRMDYKSGISAGLSIIDDGKNVMRIDNKNRMVLTRSALPAANDNISLLLSNYEVRFKGTEKVANRQTVIVQLLPKQKGNPSKKLWIDRLTFMPLRREHYNSAGVLTTLTFYKEINYLAQIKDSDFEPPKGWRVIKPLQPDIRKLSKEQISAAVGFDIVSPKYVPSGYVLDGFYPFGRRGNAVQVRYFDGLNTISVFERPFRRGIGGLFRRPRGEADDILDHHQPKGMRPGERGKPNSRFLDNRRGRIIRVVKGDLNIMLVADIAEAELQKIADSF